tara:strand:- start:370 stop:1035 length:666 start_codon:yes stop_codon:yes gene_type:complete
MFDLFSHLTWDVTEEQAAAARNLILVSIALILGFGYLAYRTANEEYKKQNGEDLSLLKFLNNGVDVPNMKSVLVGMVSGAVFGFIDNAGLYFGMSNLDPYMKNYTENARAGLGNTFSDALGSFISVFIGMMIQKWSGINSSPIWAESVGLIIGCLIGIKIPALMKDEPLDQKSVDMQNSSNFQPMNFGQAGGGGNCGNKKRTCPNGHKRKHRDKGLRRKSR